MKAFKDCLAREWTVEVNVATLMQVKALAGVDLLEILGGDLLERLARDPILLGNVLYALCKAQADARQIADTDFGRGLAGDALAAATDALTGAIVDFFPRAQARESLRLILSKAETATAALDVLIRQRVEAISPEALAHSALATAGGSSGSAPASSASIHGN